MERDSFISSCFDRRDYRNFPHKFLLMRRLATFFLPGLLFLLTFSSLTSGLNAEEIEKDETVFISGIKIKGLKDIKAEKIRDSMITPFPSKKPWKDSPEFNEQFLEDDIKRIEEESYISVNGARTI